MASTYSDLLRLELIESGAQAGIWGNTTNVNLGSLLEDAITGVSSIVLTASPTTLTALDGAPDQARCAVLSFSESGTLPNPTVIKIQNTQKLYVVRNDTSVGLEFDTVSGATYTYTVEPGDATLVFCDGANVYPGIKTANVGIRTVATGGTGVATFGTGGLIKSSGGTANLTAGDADLTTDVTGVLPIANGGTNASSVASGLVRSSGTALSGGATVALGSEVTGTLPLANGGTGQTSFAAGILRSNGSALSTGAVSLASGSTDITGTLALANGGTGTTSVPTQGQVLMGNGSGAWTPGSLVAGSNITLTTSTPGQITIASTASGGSGSVTSVSMGTGSTGLTVSGGTSQTITTSGTFTIGGTLALGFGGTGATTAAGARTALGVSATGADTTYAFRANNLSDLTSASTARSNLGLGSVATLNSVSLTSNVTGVLPVANGGTNTSSPPGCLVRATGGQSLTNNTWTIVQYATEVYDPTNAYNTSTYRFLPTVAGYYWVSVSATLNAASAQCYFTLSVYVNGSTYISSNTVYIPLGGVITTSASAYVYLNGSSDYVQGYAIQGNGSSAAQSLRADADYNVLSATFVRG